MRFFLLALGLGLLAGCAAAPEKEEAAMPMDTICEANECAAVHMFDGPAGEPVFAPVFLSQGANSAAIVSPSTRPR